MIGDDKKVIRGIVENSMYKDLRQLSFDLNISMSKIIGICLMQGMEVIRAEAIGEKPQEIEMLKKILLDIKNGTKSVEADTVLEAKSDEQSEALILI